MMTWNYRVFREEDGDYIIREVFYDENGAILGCTADAVEPVGRTLEELAEDIASFQAALNLPVLSLADIPAQSKEAARRERGNNRSIEEVIKAFALEPTPQVKGS